MSNQWRYAQRKKTGDLVEVLILSHRILVKGSDGKIKTMAASKASQYEILDTEIKGDPPKPIKAAKQTVIVHREAIPRYEQWRSEQMLELCRCSPCIKCGKPPRSDPSHRNSGDKAMGKRSSDMTIPLCRSHHEELDLYKVKDSDYEWLKLHWKWHLQLLKEGKLLLLP